MNSPPHTCARSPGRRALPRWKRTVDLVACIPALPLLAACAVVMTLLTRFISPGPVFFTQQRVGFQGRQFKIYKFRTMHLSADTRVHQNHFKQLVHTKAAMTKLDAGIDSRLIPGGWLFRATGLDELPQFINVLLGEMSLVGPRPCIPTEYEDFFPHHLERFDAMPGLTGLWQVSGKNRTTFEEMIRLDIEYARKISPSLDLRIILTTAPALSVQIWDTARRRALAQPPVVEKHSLPTVKPLRHGPSRQPF